MRTKKFKTVSGYLRSNEYGLDQNTYKLKDDERVAAVRNGQRDILNNLLPQIDGLPTINTDEMPIDGINRLLAAGGTEKQIKALKDCQRWLKNYRIITITIAPQVKTADGLVSYHVQGFSRRDDNVRVSVIIDATEYGGGAHAIAEQIAGPDYYFHSSSNILHLVPDEAKNRLFFSDKELFAAVPEMEPPARLKGGRL